MISIKELHNKKITMIACVDECFSVGHNGKLLHKISEDQKLFREITIGHICVMGRRTFEEIGKPLDGRINIVISTTMKSPSDGSYFVASNMSEFKLILSRNEYFPKKNIFVIGGRRVWEMFSPLTDRVILTHVPTMSISDTKFPTKLLPAFHVVDEKTIATYDGSPIVQKTYEPKNNVLISSHDISESASAVAEAVLLRFSVNEDGVDTQAPLDLKLRHLQGAVVRTNIRIYRKPKKCTLHAQISNNLYTLGVSLERVSIDSNGYVCVFLMCHNSDGVHLKPGTCVADVCMIGNYEYTQQ